MFSQIKEPSKLEHAITGQKNALDQRVAALHDNFDKAFKEIKGLFGTQDHPAHQIYQAIYTEFEGILAQINKALPETEIQEKDINDLFTNLKKSIDKKFSKVLESLGENKIDILKAIINTFQNIALQHFHLNQTLINLNIESSENTKLKYSTYLEKMGDVEKKLAHDYTPGIREQRTRLDVVRANAANREELAADLQEKLTEKITNFTKTIRNELEKNDADFNTLNTEVEALFTDLENLKNELLNYNQEYTAVNNNPVKTSINQLQQQYDGLLKKISSFHQFSPQKKLDLIQKLEAAIETTKSKKNPIIEENNEEIGQVVALTKLNDHINGLSAIQSTLDEATSLFGEYIQELKELNTFVPNKKRLATDSYNRYKECLVNQQTLANTLMLQCNEQAFFSSKAWDNAKNSVSDNFIKEQVSPINDFNLFLDNHFKQWQETVEGPVQEKEQSHSKLLKQFNARIKAVEGPLKKDQAVCKKQLVDLNKEIYHAPFEDYIQKCEGLKTRAQAFDVKLTNPSNPKTIVKIPKPKQPTPLQVIPITETENPIVLTVKATQITQEDIRASLEINTIETRWHSLFERHPNDLDSSSFRTLSAVYETAKTEREGDCARNFLPTFKAEEETLAHTLLTKIQAIKEEIKTHRETNLSLGSEKLDEQYKSAKEEFKLAKNVSLQDFFKQDNQHNLLKPENIDDLIRIYNTFTSLHNQLKELQPAPQKAADIINNNPPGSGPNNNNASNNIPQNQNNNPAVNAKKPGFFARHWKRISNTVLIYSNACGAAGGIIGGLLGALGAPVTAGLSVGAAAGVGAAIGWGLGVIIGFTKEVIHCKYDDYQEEKENTKKKEVEEAKKVEELPRNEPTLDKHDLAPENMPDHQKEESEEKIVGSQYNTDSDEIKASPEPDLDNPVNSIPETQKIEPIKEEINSSQSISQQPHASTIKLEDVVPTTSGIPPVLTLSDNPVTFFAVLDTPIQKFKSAFANEMVKLIIEQEPGVDSKLWLETAKNNPEKLITLRPKIAKELCANGRATELGAQLGLSRNEVIKYFDPFKKDNATPHYSQKSRR